MTSLLTSGHLCVERKSLLGPPLLPRGSNRGSQVGAMVLKLQDLAAYYKGSLFLPRLNNEIASNRNATYKSRLQRLNHLVLVKVGLLLFLPTMVKELIMLLSETM